MGGEIKWGRWNMNGSHEHSSDVDDDDDNDDEESPKGRLRTRSFSDAEDILNGLNGVGYYESFTMPNNSNTITSNGLHHRVRAVVRNGSLDEADEDTNIRLPLQQNHRYGSSCRSPPRSSNNASSRRFNKHHGRRPSLFKLCLAFGFGSYLILLVRSSYWLAKSSQDYEYRSASGERPVLSINSLPEKYDSTGMGQRYTVRRLSRIDLEARSAERRARARPAVPSVDGVDIAWYSLENSDKKKSNEPRSRRNQKIPESSIPATLNHLCGFHAQNSSLTKPDKFPMKAAVNSDSRVLITGILNPIGFPLALYLREQCGVDVIAGIDAMYPNTVLNRLQLQDRIELLTTTIPKLVKPIILPFIGLDPRQKKDNEGDDNTASNKLKSTSEFNIASLNPTHIVHLSSCSHEVYSNAMINPQWNNDHSPYISGGHENYNPHFFQMRSSMSSMEQILESIATIESPEERPQFIFASTIPDSDHNPVHKTTKLMDEIMADSYHSTYGIRSTSIRLPSHVYGPWGLPGSPIHDMTETLARKWNETRVESIEVQKKPNAMKSTFDMTYVQDAVDAIIGTMQMRLDSGRSTVEVESCRRTNSAAVADALNSFLPNVHVPKQHELLDTCIGLEPENNTQVERSGLRSPDLKFTPRTSLKLGMVRTIAWHLDRESPFGPSVETGDQLLKRFGQDTCLSDNASCHMGRPFLPCSSECNTKDRCLPSVLDAARKLAYNATEGCNIVLYTQSLGYNVQEMPLHGEYMDDADIGDDEELICNYAFVPRESDLVKSVTEKVPNDQLAKFGITPHASDLGNAMQERKLDGLNGRLLYRGWILIWVKDGMKPMSAADKSLLKLSPGRFFHPDVHHALYVEENFPVSPSIDDVTFLVEQMKRRSLPHRTVKGTKAHEGKNGETVKEKVKYQLPEEPPRRATILFSPLRVPNIEDPAVQKYRVGGKKLNVYDAIKFMRHEVGEKWGEKESATLRLQREFYERVPSLINRNGELRSSFEPSYRYNMRHWVRTRWVVHDLTIEDGRLLRCDWYQEHVQWGNDLDQLSFAYVMAQREIKRRIAHDEVDDHVKTLIDEHPELKEYTDSHEWHPLETEENMLYREPINWNPEIPPNLIYHQIPPVFVEAAASENDKHDEKAPLFVRIMSERVMGAARKVWNAAKEKKQNKQGQP